MWASKVMTQKSWDKPNLKLANYFVSHRKYSWQVAPQQSLRPLRPAV
jgi:hypothetical protein